MSRSIEAFQGSASGMASGGHPREATSHVYNIDRFQKDGPPSSVAGLAGGASPRDHGDVLRGHLSLIGQVDTMLGGQPAQGSAGAGAGSNAYASGYGQSTAQPSQNRR